MTPEEEQTARTVLQAELELACEALDLISSRCNSDCGTMVGVVTEMLAQIVVQLNGNRIQEAIELFTKEIRIKVNIKLGGNGYVS